jgi:peptidoglycan/xylan/chitin deacetylase (PgdA/CDA1 family)/spore germination protein YaaH
MRLSARLLAVALTALCCALAARPVQAAPAARIVLAFYDGDTGDYSRLSRLPRDHVTHLAPSGLYLAADGGLHQVGDLKTLVSIAHGNDVKVLPMVQNYRDGAFQAGDLKPIASAASRQVLADQIVQAVIAAGGDGVDLDFEMLPAGLAPAFVSFVSELAGRLHSGGRTLVVDIAANQGAYDVAHLQSAADWLLLMAYDQHNLPGKPGPIASLTWVEATLHQLLTTVAPGRVLLGLAGYGYDWGPQTVEPLSFGQFMQRAVTPGTIHWDPSSREPWYTYAAGDGSIHTAWFSDAASLQPLVLDSLAAGLAGIGLWRMGTEDEGLWQLMAGPPSSLGSLSVISITPTLSGSGEVAGVAGFQHLGRRSLVVDGSGRVATEQYLDLPAGIQLHETSLRPGTVGLTFDDGPDPRWTPHILDLLRRYHAHATFFVIGSQVAVHPDLVRRMYEEGNEVANHTYTHATDLERAPEWRFSLELSLTQRVVSAATGHSATLFRYPFSASLSDPNLSAQSLYDVAQQGYQIAGSGIDTLDWMRPGTSSIVSSALADPDGQTILLHDGGGDRSQTVAALPAILAGLQARHLQVLPVGAAIGEPPAAIMPATPQPDLLVDSVLLGTIWAANHGGSLWFAVVNAVALFAFARVMILGFLAILHWALGRRRPAIAYRGPVSVVVAAHNEEKVIARTLEALLASDHPELEIILADDGSTDRTVQIASALTHWGVRVLPLLHGGKANALRAGFASASHPIVVAIDADTIVAPQAVRRLVEPFGDPRVGAVAGNPKVGNRHTLLTRFQVLEYVLTLNLERRVYTMLRCVPVVPGAVGAWRWSAVARLGGFKPDTLAEDTDLTLALGRAGYRVVYVPDAVAYTEAPETLRQLARQRNRWAFGMLQCLWKHRAATLNPRLGALGLVVVPGLWIAQLFFPLMAPTIDLGLLLSPLFAWGPQLLVEVAAYNTVLLLLCVWALIVDREPVGLALLAPIQNLFYRQFMYVVALRAVVRALKGIRVGWTRVTRLGTLPLRQGAR